MSSARVGAASDAMNRVIDLRTAPRPTLEQLTRPFTLGGPKILKQPPKEQVMPNKIARNADGSAILTLLRPIQFNGEEVDRVTIPAIKGKHLMMCPIKVNDPTGGVELGTLVKFAGSVVLPTGVVDELFPEDALAVAVEVGSALGKGQQTGEPASP